MIDHYGERMPGRGITIRINPGFGHGHSQKTNTGGQQSKHGIWHEQLGASLELIQRSVRAAKPRGALARKRITRAAATAP